MKIALLTMEALAAARAVRRFVASDPGRIALVGFSDPFRREAGGALRQSIRRLRSSGPRLLPYLFLNFTAPRLVGAVRPRPPEGDVEATPLGRTCARLGLPTTEVGDVNGPAFRDALLASGADLLLTFHFDQILRADIIAAAPMGGINVHCGLLPQHRGPVPTIHALLDDPVTLGCSVHRLVPKIDAGALLAQIRIPDDPRLSAIEAAACLHMAVLPTLDAVLADIADGRATETPLPTLPYRGFPTPAELARLAAKGRRAAGWRDVRTVWSTPA